MKLVLLLFSFCACFVVRTQIGFSEYSSDTLLSDFHTFGSMSENNEGLGVLDQSFISIENPHFFLSSGISRSFGSAIDQINLKQRNIKQKISALPHIGFGYIFGSQGAQRLSFQYGQVLPNNWVINTQIKTYKLEGFFRNTAYSQSHYGFSLSKQSDKFGILISGNTNKAEREWSGGVLNDSLLDFFAPQFIPVLKESCNSTLKRFNAALGSYFVLFNKGKLRLNYVNESSVFGLNRIFNETDTLGGIYENIYIDTLVSRDQFQHSTLDHFSGLRMQSNNSQYSIGAKASYWNYRNMGLFRDTLELDVEHKFKLEGKRFKFNHSASYNVLGAFRNWELSQAISYKQENIGLNGFISYQFNNSFVKNIPQVYQRFYLSNNTAYNNSNMNLESSYTQELSAKLHQGMGKNHLLNISLTYGLGIQRDIYYFDSQILNWDNNSSLSDNSIHQLKFKIAYQKNNLNIRQSYQYTYFNTQRLIIPRHYLYGSVDYKMGVFKDKKMELTLGLTYSLSSKTNIIPVIENMGVYDFLNIDIDNFQNSLFNMGAYTSIEIETFRFFLKVNNIGYLWNDLQWNYVEGIYLPEVAVRVGITWDFWN